MFGKVANEKGKETSVKIVSPGINVTLYAHGISSVRMDGIKIPVNVSEPNSVSVNISEGTFKLELF